MRLTLEILNSNSICADDNIIVVCESRMFCIFGHDLHVETSAILDGECLVVELAEKVDILVVDFADCNWERFSLQLLCHLSSGWIFFIDLYVVIL